MNRRITSHQTDVFSEQARAKPNEAANDEAVHQGDISTLSELATHDMSALNKMEMLPSSANPRKLRSAIRLVKTNDLERDKWLAVRKSGIGSSDAAAAVGLNPYKSRLELWLEKTGRDAELPQADPNDESSPMYWGILLEHVVAAHYTKRTSNRVRRVNAVLQHPEHAWMLANLDRVVASSPDVQILECKTAGINGAKLWREGVPEYIQLQVLHQLAVTGHQAADVAVLIGGQDLQIHRIHRDEAMIKQLIALEQQFWDLVLTDTAPAADGSDSAETALRALYPRDTGSVVDFSDDLEMQQVFSDLRDVRQQIVSQEQAEAQLKQRIQQRMGDCSKALFESGAISWKRSKDGSSVDLSKMQQEHPELVEQYRVVKPGSRRFLLQEA